MTSEFNIINSLKWCTQLPTRDSPQKSPIFLSNGNEWFFQFVLAKATVTWYFDLYLEFKCMSTEFKSCRGTVQVGFVKEEKLSLGNQKFEVSEPSKKEIWTIRMNDLQKKLPTDYMEGNWIKFFFSFDDVTESFLKISKEVDDKSVQTPLYIDTSFLLEGVSKDLSSLFDESLMHDVQFVCGDQAIKAHKNVLCCRSEVFATMLRTEMAEGKTGQIKIQDIESTVFKQFLRYLYTGVLPELTVDTALQIYEAADKYAVSALKKQCASFLVEHLSPENACEILVISDRHSDSDFKKNVIEYVLEEEIPFEGEILTKFCKDNSTLAAEVLNLFCLHRREKKILSQNKIN